MSRREAVLRRLIAADKARTDLLDYTHFTMPVPSKPDDVRLSRYLRGKVHHVMCQGLHDLEARRILRLILIVPPRHGKTELASRRFMSWHSGLHPEQSLIFGTYSDTFAQDTGRAVRDIVQSPMHEQVFPGYGLQEGSASVQRLTTMDDGGIFFVGRGGPITGRGGHGIVVDDPIKDRQEADSKVIRDTLWSWFTQVVASRLMTEDSWILLIQTRWHEDDLVGRLTDPMSPYYDPEEAKQWVVIDLPALALDDDPMGREMGEALWPERFSRDFLLSQQRRDPRGFQALYQGRPAAEDGAFFKADHIRTYQPDELPPNLRYYVASDHAVSTRQDRDKTCLVPVGVDEQDNIYVLSDVWWKHAATDTVVEAMLKLMQERRPLYWWAERGHISKAIGPFLRKRMAEEKTYASVIELTPVLDKQTRAQSIMGRMAMGKVFFPASAVWWPEARDQLLKFPHGRNDDFVDALAYVGLGLAQQVGATVTDKPKSVKPGSFADLFANTKMQLAANALANAMKGW